MKIKIIIVAVILVLVLPLVAYFLSPVSSATESVTVVIQKGDGLREVAIKLNEAGLIKSRPVFVLYSIFSGAIRNFQAGRYHLRPNMSVPTLTRALVSGLETDLPIVIKEGATLAEIEMKLAQAGILKSGLLSKYKHEGKSLEGFLFPDTYRFFPGSSVEDVVKKFLDNFNEKAMPVLKKGCQSGLYGCEKLSAYQILIMASIIEKEVPFQPDRHLVAGLLYKRLSIGMGLQVDAAPDTYKYAGLPPKPISNPGLDAILAAVQPQATKYLYYLSDPLTKKTIFAETFDEHVQNKFKYLRR